MIFVTVNIHFWQIYSISATYYSLMSNSSYISSVLIGVVYRNCRSNFGCLFTFCYLDVENSIKSDLHICNLWTGQFVSYKSVI